MDRAELERQIQIAMQIPDENKKRRSAVLSALAVLYALGKVGRKLLKDTIAENPRNFGMLDRDVYNTKFVDILIIMPMKSLREIIIAIETSLHICNEQMKSEVTIDTKDYKDI